MSAILTVENLGISFGSNHVLKDINFTLGEGEVLGVIGPNGAGKTVMLNILTGILKPTKGTIRFQDKEISHEGVTERCRGGIGKLGLLDRKRLEIGRALATEPKILLLDEVGGGLTESEVGLIIDLVKTIKKQGVSVIWIEHIIRTMLEGTDRVMLVADGVDVITGKPLDVMNSAEVKKVYMGGGDDE